eukprot:1194472-Rhodomonas_salina.2
MSGTMFWWYTMLCTHPCSHGTTVSVPHGTTASVPHGTTALYRMVQHVCTELRHPGTGDRSSIAPRTSVGGCP